MQVSVVIRSKDEADRLRLTLASLTRQTMAAEIVVVNDGSVDHTPAVLAEAARELPLRVVAHRLARGRAGAANAGAEVASGDVLVFLDGDTLAAPELVAAHAATHAAGPERIGRGENFHFRGTRFLQDPETATPRPGEEARLARLAPGERSRLKVTRAEVVGDFAALASRAEPGIYPGSGPRRLHELEIDALRHHPDCSVLWAAACGTNLSVPREAFRGAGGFDEALDMNEHRELALRLCQRGARMVLVDAARAYHLAHRSGWRDPLQDTRWEDVFYRAHPLLAVKLLTVFWACLDPRHRIPRDAAITSLPELEVAARGDTGADYDAVRRLIGGLSELRSVAQPAIGADASSRDAVGVGSA
jgi:glycosyltransferase involved in cell wall biosynthesis